MDISRNVLIIVKDFLPPNVELYDWGGGAYIAPTPDFGDTNSWTPTLVQGALYGTKSGKPLNELVYEYTDSGSTRILDDEIFYLVFEFNINNHYQENQEAIDKLFLHRVKLASLYWDKRKSPSMRESRFLS